jgi:hypothetical protein
MKFEINFTTDKSTGEVVASTTNYFVPQGFRLASNQFDTLVFVRGSQLANFYTFNPLNIQSKTSIHIKANEAATAVHAIFDINTAGQVITSKEEAIWQRFVNNYQGCILTGQDLLEQNQQLLQQGKKANLKYIGWAALGAILAGVPAVFVAYWVGISSIASMGAVAGGMGMMYYKINQDKEKEKNGL